MGNINQYAYSNFIIYICYKYIIKVRIYLNAYVYE